VVQRRRDRVERALNAFNETFAIAQRHVANHAGDGGQPLYADQTGGDIRCRLRVEGPPRPALAQKGRSQARPAPMRSAPGIRFEQWVKEPEGAR
jgi:hypothetical protein